MKIKALLLTILLILFSTFFPNTRASLKERTQSNYTSEIHIRGTIIMAAICRDGIVVGADSRIALEEGEKILACYEGVLKIYKYNQILIAVSGTMIFKDLTFYGLFNKFILDNKTDIPAERLHEELAKYAKEHLNPDDFSKFKKNNFLVCEYKQGKAKYFFYSPGRNSQSDSGYLATYPFTDKLDLSKMNLSKTKTWVREKLEKAIQDENAKGMSKLGGYVSIATISNKGIKWCKKRSNYLNKTSQEEFLAIKNEKKKLRYASTSINDSIKVRQVIDSGLKRD